MGFEREFDGLRLGLGDDLQGDRAGTGVGFCYRGSRKPHLGSGDNGTATPPSRRILLRSEGPVCGHAGNGANLVPFRKSPIVAVG